MTYTIKNTGINNIFLWKDMGTYFEAGTELYVPELQEAAFCREGRCLDVFSPGVYTLNENNLPLLKEDLISENININGSANIPCEVFFINKGYAANIMWGSGVPMQMKFVNEGIEASLSINGEIAFRVIDSKVCVENVLRKYGRFSQFDQQVFNRDVRGIILEKIREHLPVIISKMEIVSYNVVKCLNYISPHLRRILSAQLKKYGLEIVGFSINKFSLANNSVYASDMPNNNQIKNDMMYVPGDGGNQFGLINQDSPQQHFPQGINPVISGKKSGNKQNNGNKSINPQMMNPQMVNPQMVNPQMVNPQMVNPQMANQQMINQQMANQQMINQQMANPQMVNPQMANQQIINPQMVNQNNPKNYVENDDEIETVLIQPHLQKTQMDR